MSSLHTTAVRERLYKLEEEGYETAAQVSEYVQAGRDDTAARERLRPSTEALLTVIRLDNELALEVKDSMGRDVIAALTDDNGIVRYPLWSHSAVAAKLPDRDVRTRTLERYRGAADALEERRPHVVLRDATELSELEAPASWDAFEPRELWGGP